jgi:hypothetical protein
MVAAMNDAAEPVVEAPRAPVKPKRASTAKKAATSAAALEATGMN